jgi:hypothetical protein
MAFANYNERPWNVTNIELLDYVDKFKNLKSNKTHMFKRWLNGSRFVLLWGNNKTINFTSDWSLKSNKSEDPSREIEACIDIKNNTLTIFDVNILEQGANVFGNHFSGYITVSHHWGTRTLYEGTKHEIKGAQSCAELKSKNQKDFPYAWRGMKFDLDTYKVINDPPKEIRQKMDYWKEVTRIQRNASSRARRANLKALERLDIYRNTGNINDIEMKDAFRLFNVSERREVIDAFGMDTILASCESEVLDLDKVDNRPYEVVRVKVEDKTMPDGSRWCNYLRMVNPSTSEVHFEGVPNTQNTVQTALSWRDGDEGAYVKPIVLT